MLDPYESLGPLEADVLDLLWTSGTATARELHTNQPGSADRAYTTLMTTLDRLHKKGLLSRQKEGLAWRYAPTLSRTSFEQKRVDALVARVVGHYGDAGLAAFVDAAAAAEGPMLERLEALIRARRGR